MLRLQQLRPHGLGVDTDNGVVVCEVGRLFSACQLLTG